MIKVNKEHVEFSGSAVELLTEVEVLVMELFEVISKDSGYEDTIMIHLLPLHMTIEALAGKSVEELKKGMWQYKKIATEAKGNKKPIAEIVKSADAHKIQAMKEFIVENLRGSKNENL